MPLTREEKFKSSFKQTFIGFFFSMLGLITSNENIEQNMQENIVQCWFYETSFKIWRLISKPHTFAAKISLLVP